jgi:hypothetical protein
LADYHHSHTQLIIEELLPQAKSFVAEGQRWLAAQEAIKRKGRDTPQSTKLLMNMR